MYSICIKDRKNISYIYSMRTALISKGAANRDGKPGNANGRKGQTSQYTPSLIFCKYV
jgi:hypothetical protein